MRPSLVFTAAALLFSSISVALAADTTLLAETGGFLAGNAYRCGVPAGRVALASRIIRDMIVAAAHDPREEKAAGSRFAETFVASAFPRSDRDTLIPPCKAVVAQFERLEQHHQEAGLD